MRKPNFNEPILFKFSLLDIFCLFINLSILMRAAIAMPEVDSDLETILVLMGLFLFFTTSTWLAGVGFANAYRLKRAVPRMLCVFAASLWVPLGLNLLLDGAA